MGLVSGKYSAGTTEIVTRSSPDTDQPRFEDASRDKPDDLIWHEGTICWYGTYGHLGGRQLQAVLDAVRTLLCPDRFDALYWYVPRPAA